MLLRYIFGVPKWSLIVSVNQPSNFVPWPFKSLLTSRASNALILLLKQWEIAAISIKSLLLLPSSPHPRVIKVKAIEMGDRMKARIHWIWRLIGGPKGKGKRAFDSVCDCAVCFYKVGMPTTVKPVTVRPCWWWIIQDS